MSTQTYPLPPGLHPIPHSLLDLRPTPAIEQTLLHPAPITSDKNIWFFWATGYSTMHGYTQRNILAWHQRFSKSGWTIRVLDRVPNSKLNISKYLDITDPSIFPKAFIEGTIGGEYAPQHTSDLVRWPLLLRYGGVYADVGLMQIGDLDSLWCKTVGNAESPFEILSYNCGGAEVRDLTNYFLACRPGNPFFARCHKLLLALWNADGGKVSTEGMHASPLLKGLPLQGSDDLCIEEEGRILGAEEVKRLLTDYIIQGQVMSMVMGLVDAEGGWDGPRYCAERIYAIEFMVGSQLINRLTNWDGRKAFELMSLRMPGFGEGEKEEQKEARAIVEACLGRSFGFKLAHGFILRVFGETLGSLWREHEGADAMEGTYAGWLRYGMVYWCQEGVPPRVEFGVLEPVKRGPLLGKM